MYGHRGEVGEITSLCGAAENWEESQETHHPGSGEAEVELSSGLHSHRRLWVENPRPSLSLFMAQFSSMQLQV